MFGGTLNFFFWYRKRHHPVNASSSNHYHSKCSVGPLCHKIDVQYKQQQQQQQQQQQKWNCDDICRTRESNMSTCGHDQHIYDSKHNKKWHDIDF